MGKNLLMMRMAEIITLMMKENFRLTLAKNEKSHKAQQILKAVCSTKVKKMFCLFRNGCL